MDDAIKSTVPASKIENVFIADFFCHICVVINLHFISALGVKIIDNACKITLFSEFPPQSLLELPASESASSGDLFQGGFASVTLACLTHTITFNLTHLLPRQHDTM